MAFDQNHLSIVGNYAGKTVRYSFYFVGTIVLALIGIVVVRVTSFFDQPSSVSSKASFQINAPELARLTPRANSARFNAGWQEILQYGQVHDRDTDFTLVVNMPSNPDTPVVRDYSYEMSSLRPLLRTAYIGTATYYDLQTRFGPVRAASFRINADGQIKLCVSYLSRFETTAVYLKGWYCESSGARPNFHTLACMIDKITLKGVLPTAAAQGFFEERMKRSARCSAEPVSQTTDTRPARPPRRL
ncbi:hypothetical protein [Afipia clevelandensis]|uniref:Uncharacterized protein n=1 Tax=Afipia clevelandensis ATCC 49720 TaxID=883079 RepID=K8NRW9_9BRAD|nr:hypothetical protein [Afipia clevelandensis]EKS33117.1 hypothetical protein HMPREF9696_03158 [Afipia clevelandensis ATCC 49720]